MNLIYKMYSVCFYNNFFLYRKGGSRLLLLLGRAAGCSAAGEGATMAEVLRTRQTYRAKEGGLVRRDGQQRGHTAATHTHPLTSEASTSAQRPGTEASQRTRESTPESTGGETQAPARSHASAQPLLPRPASIARLGSTGRRSRSTRK